jgi:hypothetical protein
VDRAEDPGATMRLARLRVPVVRLEGGVWGGGKGRTHGAGLLRERTRRELRRGLTRDRLTQRAGRETHGGTRRHPASPRSKGPSADE